MEYSPKKMNELLEKNNFNFKKKFGQNFIIDENIINNIINVAKIDKETLVMDKFEFLGIIKNPVDFDQVKLDHFCKTIAAYKQKGEWNRGELIDLFNYMIPNFNHKETGKFLDGRM